MTKPIQEEVKTFDFDRVMKIADRLAEHGVPEKTIDSIKKWAVEKKAEEENRLEEAAT